MYYVVGSGRCGTRTVAKRALGKHEPKPSIINESYKYFKSKKDQENLDQLKSKLLRRFCLDTNLISDCRQSYVIPVIKEIDKEAKFVVVYREPFSCVESYLNRSIFLRGSIWDRTRIHPPEGFPKRFTRVMKVAWIVNETYRIILNDLKDDDFHIFNVSELGNKIWNKNKSKKEYGFNEDEIQFILEETQETFDSLKKLYYNRKVSFPTFCKMRRKDETDTGNSFSLLEWS